MTFATAYSPYWDLFHGEQYFNVRSQALNQFTRSPVPKMGERIPKGEQTPGIELDILQVGMLFKVLVQGF